jgi:hypothetical protein
LIKDCLFLSAFLYFGQYLFILIKECLLLSAFLYFNQNVVYFD